MRRLTAGEDPDVVLNNDLEELTLWGVPADRLPEAALDRPHFAHVQNRADPDLRLTDGSLVPAQGLNLRVVITPGLSPGHICLVDEPHGLIFSRDHVLPRISPHIALELSSEMAGR